MADMGEITFHVQGSAPEPYFVRFSKNGSNLTALCTCPAGGVGQYCKHRMRILEGSDEGIVSGNEAEVATVVSLLPGTDVEAAMTQLREAESRLEKAKTDVSALKKKLAKTLHD